MAVIRSTESTDASAAKRFDRDDLAEALILIFLGFLLCVIAASRHTFIGDGIRHLPNVLAAERPHLGEPRWLLFPALIWALIHPLAAAGWVATVDAAVRPLLATSVLAGIAYLLGLRVWLRAEGHGAMMRAPALALAAATIPFLTLYSDIAEVQLAAAAVIVALALARERTARASTSSAHAIALVAVIAAASLVYQGLLVALAFLPLVVPVAILIRRSVLIASAAIIASMPMIAAGARIWAGDSAALALTTVVMGETNPLTQAFMGTATPFKWIAAAIAGPPQAVVGLEGFAGLRALATGFRDPRTIGSALANAARLAFGAALVAALAFAIVRRRDWRLALAVIGVLLLPMIRNDQYNYAKFFVLWPAIVALGSTSFDRRNVAIVAAAVLALNGSLVARDVVRGRRMFAEMSALYSRAGANTCFFTSGWDAPFFYRWPGTTAAVIGTLATGVDPDAQARRLTASLERCFCNASAVWTDTTTDSAAVVALLANHFQYAALDLGNILHPPSGRLLPGAEPAPVLAYSPDRQAEACRQVRAAAAPP